MSDFFVAVVTHYFWLFIQRSLILVLDEVDTMSNLSVKTEQSAKQEQAIDPSSRSLARAAKSSDLEELEEEASLGLKAESSTRKQLSVISDDGEMGEDDSCYEGMKEEGTESVEEDVDYDMLAMELQSPPSTTFSELAGKMKVTPLRDKPVYRNVLKYVRAILEELVNKNTGNVLCHFGEWSRRVINRMENTYGISQELFLPVATNYIRTLKSFTYDWKDVLKPPEMMGEDSPGNESIVKSLNKISESVDQLQAISNVDDVAIKDDDWDQGGYMHYVDRKAEPKEPPFDEFEYVTLEQQAFFDEVGIGLPKHERYEIHMALQKLAKVRNLTAVRFWGKIFGLFQDYYIAEAVMKPEDMKIDDFEDLPAYEESDYVGEWCEDLLIEELGETETVRDLEPEEIAELLDEDLSEEHRTAEVYGEYYGEYDEEEGPANPKLSEQPTFPSVTFDGFPQDPLVIPNDELEIGEEMLGEQESVFELEVDDGKFKGKMTLKNYKLPLLPRIKEKPIKLPPPEEPGEGTNKFVFFVTNDTKYDWIRLPHVTPEQIVVARQIRKFFTGYLTARVNSFPKFPGIEIHLLRAQIARISAGTQVSPAGYYRFFDEGEEAADAFDVAAGQGGKIILNRDFEPLTVKDLTDPTCTFWVHHTAHILKQGRTVWYNVNQKGPRERVEGMEDEEEGEEAPPFKEVIGEKGPPLLTSCAEDLFMEAIPPWTVKPAIEQAPHEGCVYVRSNLWPGSYSFAFGRKIGFMYHGWGLKALSYGYTPPPPYLPMKEYPLGPDIIEITDPTPYQEEEYRLKLAEWLKKREKHPPMGEGEGGEGGEGADEDEE